MKRETAYIIAIAGLGVGLEGACNPANVLAGVDDGPMVDSSSRRDALPESSSTPLDGTVASDSAPDAAFVCTPPADASQSPVIFTGKRFDSTGGCLVGGTVSLPICGCFNGTGHDSSTWCFAAPDGTTYFGVSADGCTVEMPPGWYATQTAGPSPSGTATAAQEAACARVAATSTAMGSYDRPGPPDCVSDGGSP
jgi:hypothetical protein